MKARIWIMAFAALTLGAAVGCGDDGGSGTDADTDSTTGEDTDTGTDEDSGTGEDPPTSGVSLQTGGNVDPSDSTLIEDGSGTAADYSCAGTVTMPEGGDDVTFKLTINDFQGAGPTEGVCVETYPSNEVETDDECSGETTDENGQVDVTAPEGGWFAYRVYGQEDPVGSLQYSLVAPGDGGDVSGSSVAASTINLIPVVLGSPRTPGTGLFAGSVRDCTGALVYGATVKLYDSNGDEVVEPADRVDDDPFYRFFNGESFPAGAQRWTHVDGLFVVGNVEPGRYTVEVWGAAEAGGTPEVIGCEEGEVIGDAVTIISTGALRSDGPTCPGAS